MKKLVLSLTFDDGLNSHYEIVYPLLKEKNFGATFFIVVDLEKDPLGRELMSSSQIQDLANSGFEIGSHTVTHPFLTQLTEKEIEEEFKKSKQILEDNYGVIVSSVAFPYGNYNDKVINIAKKYYLTGRIIYNQRPVGFLLNTVGINKTSDVDSICKYMDEAKEKKSWVILVFHDISDSPGVWDTSIDSFKEILKCAEKVGIRVDSVSGCREIIS